MIAEIVISATFEKWEIHACEVKLSVFSFYSEIYSPAQLLWK